MAKWFSFAALFCSQQTSSTLLQEGSKAPLFKGIDEEGNTLSLADYRGTKVVLYFYPQDGTPTCTVQACNLRDSYGLLKAKGFEIIGISPDDANKHKRFKAKHGLPFRLIADPEHTILEQYGVWGEKQMFGNKYMGVHRTTFVLDEKGTIRKIFTRPKSKAHAEEILAAMA